MECETLRVQVSGLLQRELDYSRLHTKMIGATQSEATLGSNPSIIKFSILQISGCFFFVNINATSCADETRADCVS